VAVLKRTRALIAVGFLACLLVVTLGVGSSSGSPAKVAKYGDGLITVVGSFGPTYNGQNFNPFQSASHGAVQFMYVPMMALNVLTGQLQPFLATSVKPLGTMGVQFTLRRGVKWSDGKPLTAQDVIFTFNMLKKNPANDTIGIGPHLASVTAKGNVVTFRYNAPAAPLYKQIANTWIVPQHTWAAVTDAVNFTNPNPVVSGPYRLAEATSTKDLLLKNPKFYDRTMFKVKGFELLADVPGPQQVPNLQSGKYDWDGTGDFTQGGFEKDWKSLDPKNNGYWIVPQGNVTIFLNDAKAPFNDVAVRRALSLALNRVAISKVAAPAGYEPPSAQTGLLPIKGDQVYAPNVPNKGIVKFDLAGAKKTLTDAGYTYSGNKLIGKDGKQVKITFQTVNGFTDWIAAAQLVKKSWDDLGVDVTVETPQIGALIGGLVNGQYDAATWITTILGTPYFNFQNMVDGALYQPIGAPAGGNWSRYKSPVADSLLRQAERATTFAAEKKAISGLASLVYNQVPFIHLMAFPGWYSYSNRDYVGWPSAKNPYAYGLFTPGNTLAKSTGPLIVASHLRPAPKAKG
jgi:peptide/nickel transport system substrate-binding protein